MCPTATFFLHYKYQTQIASQNQLEKSFPISVPPGIETGTSSPNVRDANRCAIEVVNDNQ